MRVAFVGYSSRVWTGGYNYLLNASRSLVHYAPEIEPWLFVAPEIDEDDLAPFRRLLADRVVRDKALAPDRVWRRYGRALVFGRDEAASSLFRRYNIDVIFEAYTFYGWRFPIPTVAWFGDFQHREHPEFFSRTNYWRREFGHWLQRLSGRTVVVSSQSVGADARRYYRLPLNRLQTVRFAVWMDAAPSDEDCQTVRKRYALPTRFLFLPNQFWQHKNHRLIAQAVGRLKEQGIILHVVASGNTKDHRQPDTFAALTTLIADLGIQDRFHILGMIPYRDVLTLASAASAVLNPSIAEGWSTTVEEAKALGTPLALSDIPVHREQAPPATRFFNPFDGGESAATELAQAILVPPSTHAERAHSLEAYEENRRHCAAALSRAFIASALKSPIGKRPGAHQHGR